MDESENPYEILGVTKTATATEIKAAYRKLALRHHPDKQTTDDDKQRAHAVFAKISNAYELLSDEKTRHKYDREQQVPVPPSTRHHHHHDAYPQPDYDNYYETPLHGRDDFFENHFQRHRTQHPFAFHDPFEIFSQVFGEEFGTRRNSHQQQQQQRGGFDNRGFMDPFQAHRSMFNDPFFGSGFGGGGGLFGGPDPFSSMNRQMGMMNQMMQQQQQQQANGSRGAGGPQVFYSSSSSSFGGGGGGPRGSVTSVSTTTRIINGKRQTVTERITTKPDGTIERHVETSGDEDFPQLQQRQSQALPQPTPPQLQSRRSSRSQPPREAAAPRQLEHKPQHPRPPLDDDDDHHHDQDGDHDQSNKRSRFSWRRKS